jgi:hypothetical protein
MKKLIGLTAIISGMLLIVLPRYVLPACEYAGFSRMHCSDTAQAELIAGFLLMLTGMVTLFLTGKGPAMGAGMGVSLSAASFALPDVLGFCHNSRMPCNYGMVPGIRFIAVLSGVILLPALIMSVKEYRKKGNA